MNQKRLPRGLKPKLDRLIRNQDRARHLERDPLGIVREFSEGADREVVGLLASSLAFGNVTTIRRSIRRVLEALGPRPAAALEQTTTAALSRKLRGFRHRVYRGPHISRLLTNAAAVRAEHGTIGALMMNEFSRTGGDFRESLARVADALRGKGGDRGMRHLMSDPRAGSACKRLLLYTRWMARPDDGLDLGLWQLSPKHLVMPIDTHVHRISRNLGLTLRKDASWKTAVEVTEALRGLDPQDPVKYDFALCHLGISQQCPSRRVTELCDRCDLRKMCTQWQ